MLAAIGLVALSLAACNDPNWLGELTKEIGNKGGPSSGATGGRSATGGAASCAPGSGGTGGQSACRADVFGGDGVCFDVPTLKKNAYLACDKAGLVLGDYVPYDPCGTESYLFTKYTCCPKVTTPPPPAPQCETKSQGSETSCKSADVWRQYAGDDCAATGAKMDTYSPYGDCGNGGFRYVKYICCGQPTPPPAPECSTGVQGSDTSCKPAGVWKQYASEACTAAAATLTGYSPYEDCGDGNTRYVKYTCCRETTPPPPPPPAPECSTSSQGSETSCKPGYVWKQSVTDACAAAAASPTDISPYDDCGDGNFRYVKYTCCRQTTPPPPPPPAPECSTANEGSATTCKSASVWKQYLSEACTAAAATLTSYSPYEDCGDGSFRYVKYTCCRGKEAAPVPPGK